jgi:hypothetical protein
MTNPFRGRTRTKALVLDEKIGTALASRSPVRMFNPGPTMKTIAVADVPGALRQRLRLAELGLPSGHPECGHTPNGERVLVGWGDLLFGPRKQPDGPLYDSSIEVGVMAAQEWWSRRDTVLT